MLKFSSLNRIFKKALKLGPQKSFQIIKRRADNKLSDFYCRFLAKAGLANHGWKFLTKKHGLSSNSDFLLDNLKQKKAPFLQNIYTHKYIL